MAMTPKDTLQNTLNSLGLQGEFDNDLRSGLNQLYKLAGVEANSEYTPEIGQKIQESLTNLKNENVQGIVAQQLFNTFESTGQDPTGWVTSGINDGLKNKGVQAFHAQGVAKLMAHPDELVNALNEYDKDNPITFENHDVNQTATISPEQSEKSIGMFMGLASTLQSATMGTSFQGMMPLVNILAGILDKIMPALNGIMTQLGMKPLFQKPDAAASKDSPEAKEDTTAPSQDVKNDSDLQNDTTQTPNVNTHTTPDGQTIVVNGGEVHFHYHSDEALATAPNSQQHFTAVNGTNTASFNLSSMAHTALDMAQTAYTYSPLSIATNAISSAAEFGANAAGMAGDYLGLTSPEPEVTTAPALSTPDGP